MLTDDHEFNKLVVDVSRSYLNLALNTMIGTNALALSPFNEHACMTGAFLKKENAFLITLTHRRSIDAKPCFLHHS